MNPIAHQAFESKPVMSGTAMSDMLGSIPLGARAVIAWAFTDLKNWPRSRKQAAQLTGVSSYNIAMAGLATADEREALLDGVLSIRAVRKAHAHARPCQPLLTTLEDCILYFGAARVIEDIIERVGANEVMFALDRLTAPAPATPSTETVVQFATAAE
jgi:hypothetical protein